MLTDIFADRYSTVELWSEFGEPERRLLVQGFRILSEQIRPYYWDGKEYALGKTYWTELHSRISMELGLQHLAETGFVYQTTWQGKTSSHTSMNTMHRVCELWMMAEFDGSVSPDRFVKERLSLVEIGFRIRGDEIAAELADLPNKIARATLNRPIGRSVRLPGNPADGLKAQYDSANDKFRQSVDELNTRFRQAGCNLNFHNGFIQLAEDSLVSQELETPFWALVADPKWSNVDIDMKEALDRRDNDGRDPAFYAARALESVLKIVSSDKGLTHGGEKGAHNFIDNLASKKARFVADWEADALKTYFTKVRNPFGHGAGTDEMPSLTPQQTDWAIESSMAWIKSIVRRL